MVKKSVKLITIHYLNEEGNGCAHVQGVSKEKAVKEFRKLNNVCITGVEESKIIYAMEDEDFLKNAFVLGGNE